MFFFFIIFLQVRFSSVAAIETLDVQENVIKGNSRNLGTFCFIGLFSSSLVLWWVLVFFFFLKFWNLFFNFFLGDCKAPEWKKLSSKELGLSNSLISMPTKKVLNGLKKNGIVLGHNELFCICGFSLFCWRWKET
jgi:hypothetical protein